MAACTCDTFDRSVVITAASSASIDPLSLTVVNDSVDNRRARLYLGTSHPVAGSIQGQPAIQIGAAQGAKAPAAGAGAHGITRWKYSLDGTRFNPNGRQVLPGADPAREYWEIVRNVSSLPGNACL